MASPFWRYFNDILAWPLIHAPGPIQALAQGVALTMDEVRDDIVYLRKQFFPALCDQRLVSAFGKSRGLVRHHTETEDQFRTRVVNAWRWHELGGKTEGLPEILRFYGYEVEAIENMRKFSKGRWAEFMVRLKTPASFSDQQEQVRNLKTLLWLINEYKPARSFFFRLYNDSFDRRPIILSIGPKLGSGWLSLWSGKIIPEADDTDTIISFGLIAKFQGEKLFSGPGKCALHGLYATRGMRRLNAFMLGRSRLSDIFIRRHSFVFSELISLQNAERYYTPHEWKGPWSGPWVECSGWTRFVPAMRLRVLSFARSQLIPGHRTGGILSTINGRLGPIRHTFVIDGSPRLGTFRLSEHGPIRRKVCITEYHAQKQGVLCQTISPQDVVLGLSAVLSAQSQRLYDNDWQGTWSGPWDKYQLFVGVGNLQCIQGNQPVIDSASSVLDAIFAMQASSASLDSMQGCGQSVLSLGSQPLRNQRWSGKWENRRWWDYCGETSIA